MTTEPLARLLIVDDEERNVNALCETLRDHGYDPEGATSGEEALRMLGTKFFDVLLTDLMMPGMSGVQLLSAVQAIDPHIVGILMTGKGTIETAVQSMQAGALDYVLKPLKLAALLPVLGRAFLVRQLRLENLELRDTVAIHELTEAIAHTLDADVLLAKVADAALEQFGADEVSVMLPAEDGRSLYVAAVRGEHRETLLGTRMPLGSGIAGHVAAKRETLVFQSAASDARVMSTFPRPDIQTAVCMPMIARNALVGVLNVNFTRKARAISAGQIRVLSIFLNGAAAGIAAARLFEAERKAHDELIRAQRMETLGRLAGGVAHDFNNLLTVILAGCELAEAEVPTDNAARPIVRDIAAAGKRAADLTQQLLAFSRRQIPTPRVLDVNAQVRALEGLLRRMAPHVDIAITLCAEPWHVRMDPSQLDQVILNLAVNARDAMPDSGALRIETANVTPDAAECAAQPGFSPGDYVLLSVKDTGHGMDAETLRHAFEPFFTTKAEGKGTGIGLASVHGIVQQNHGVISLHSEPGLGTLVRVYLPRSIGASPAQNTIAGVAATVRGQETVLLVDDDNGVRQLAKRVLLRLGYRVLEAAGAEAAFALCSQHNGEIHLLLSDIAMPGMDGLDMADRIIALRPDISTLFMSGYAPSQVAARQFGGDGLNHIQKPFDIASLSTAVRNALAPRAAS